MFSTVSRETNYSVQLGNQEKLLEKRKNGTPNSFALGHGEDIQIDKW